MKAAAASIDDYLSRVPPNQRVALEALRRQILAAAPGAEEGISYGLPTFKLNGSASRPSVSAAGSNGKITSGSGLAIPLSSFLSPSVQQPAHDVQPRGLLVVGAHADPRGGVVWVRISISSRAAE
jgi:hypothetical protein